MNPHQEPPPTSNKPTGRRYDSIKSLMRGEGVPEAIQKQVAELAKGRSLGLQLAQIRTREGITQAEMAKRLGTTQGAISKLEAAFDSEINVKDIQQYSLICGQRISLTFGKPINHVEAVKLHALSIKSHLEDLARIANSDESLEKEISGFFGEAFFNILEILASCSDKLPAGGSDFEMKIEVVRNNNRRKAYRPEMRETIAA